MSGYYGFSNAGDEAMLTAIVTALQKQDPSVEITVISGHPQVTTALHPGVKAIHRFNPFGILAAMLRADLLLSGGGSLLQNVTSRFSLFYYLSLIGLAGLLGRHVMLFAQGIGPIHGGFCRWLTRKVCSLADLITVRDDGSLEDLSSMGMDTSNILVTSDAVFNLPPGCKETGKEQLRQFGLNTEQPIIAFALRHWRGEARFIREFARAADELQQLFHAQILFLPLQFPADAELSERVWQAMEQRQNVFILQQRCSTQTYQDIISNVQLLIGMRLHALVFAAINDVPFMAVSYDPKVDRFVDGMKGCVVNTIDHITSKEITAMAQKLWDADGHQGQEEILQLRQEAARNITRALALMK